MFFRDGSLTGSAGEVLPNRLFFPYAGRLVATLCDGGGWSTAVSGLAGRGKGDVVAGGSGRYYRAGHWVNKSAGSRGGRSVKKQASTAVVVGLLIVGAWLGLFSHGSAHGSDPKPGPSSSAGR
jgi:hypothetical protein